jgi:hypothetical protein
LVARRTICFDATSVRIPACANKKGKIRKEWKKKHALLIAENGSFFKIKLCTHFISKVFFMI